MTDPHRGQTALALLLLLAVVALAASAGTALGQPQPSLEVAVHQVDDADFSSVRLVVGVTDEAGRPLTGLTAEDFLVEAGEVRLPLQDARTVLDAGTGIGVVLVIDVSGSMEGAPLDTAKEVSREFIRQLGPVDTVAVQAFNEEVPTVQGFTAEEDVSIAAIQSLVSGGDTALYGAVAKASALAQQSDQARRAILLLSDGRDTASLGPVTRETSIETAKASGVPFFVVGLGNAVDEPYLSLLAQTTGARFYRAPTPEDLRLLFDAISALLRTQYVLTIDGGAIPADQPSLTVAVEHEGRLGRAERALPDDFFRPRLSLSGLPGEEIAEPVALQAQITAPRGVAAVEYLIDGRTMHTTSEAPYQLPLDPIDLAPGEHELTVVATDARGSRGEASGAILIAAVSPRISIVNAKEGTVISGLWELELDVRSQVPLVTVEAFVGGEPLEDSEMGRFHLDTQRFSEGQHALVVRAVDEAGGAAEATLTVQLRHPAGGGSSAALLALVVLPALAVAGGLAVLWYRWRRRRREPPPGVAETPSGPPPPPQPVPVRAGDALEPPPAPLPRARLTLARGGDGHSVFLIEGEPVTIGSDPSCTIVLADASGRVAPREARVWLREDRFMLHRLPRRYGAQAPSRPSWAVLESGDEITVGPYRFTFEIITDV